MKIQNIKDINNFFGIIRKCKGKIELISLEGDCINLKSRLSQYIAMANICSDVYIKELELRA